MYSIYRTNTDELNINFINALKAQFAHQEIEIVVCEVPKLEDDETTYLNSSEANKKKLLKPIDNIKHNQNLVNVDFDDFS